MDCLQYEALRRHFETRRLHPWIPEHELFIRGEIAKLEVTDPTAAVSFEEFYEQKMETYKQEHPEEFGIKPAVEPEKTESVDTPSMEDLHKVIEDRLAREAAEEETPVETPVVEVAEKEPKKRGRKPKIV